MQTTTIGSILILAIALAAAFFAGRCTKQNILTGSVTTSDTLFITDTLRLPPVPHTVQVEKLVYVKDQKSLDSLARIARRRANLFNSLAERSKSIIAEMQYIIDSLTGGVGFPVSPDPEAGGVGFAIAEDWPVNFYQGDTITESKIAVTWKIKTLGELYESPELVITSPFVESNTRTWQKAKNRALGLQLAGVHNWKHNETFFLPSLYHRRGAVSIGAGPILGADGTMQGGQVYGGIEIKWRSKQ